MSPPAPSPTEWEVHGDCPIDPRDKRLPSGEAMDETTDIDRSWFREHPDRKHYIRPQRADEMAMVEISNDVVNGKSLARNLLLRYRRYSGAGGELMVPLTVVRQLWRAKTGDGQGVRMRAWFHGLQRCCDAGESEARFIWNECNKGRTMNGIPADEVVAKLEAAYAKLDV